MEAGALAPGPRPISQAGTRVSWPPSQPLSPGLASRWGCASPLPSRRGLKGSGRSPAWLGRHEEERAHAVPLLPAACGKDRACGSASPPQDGDGGTG